ncbi:MAG: hypothetical protein ABI678_13125 [Kofleriaceae bacterium]
MSFVPAKDRDKRRATWNAWYQRTKHLKKANVPRQSAVKLARRRAISTWLSELKAELRCRVCGIDHPGCLVFHHVDRDLKDREVAAAITRGWSKARVRAELTKCLVLCANCHIKLHMVEDDRA